MEKTDSDNEGKWGVHRRLTGYKEETHNSVREGFVGLNTSVESNRLGGKWKRHFRQRKLWRQRWRSMHNLETSGSPRLEHWVWVWIRGGTKKTKGVGEQQRPNQALLRHLDLTLKTMENPKQEGRVTLLELTVPPSLAFPQQLAWPWSYHLFQFAPCCCGLHMCLLSIWPTR